jgi:o-succinylbenzoate synthase
LGEVSILPGLSPESPNDIERLLNLLVKNTPEFIRNFDLSKYPAVKFGLETALLDLKMGGSRSIYPSLFTEYKKGIKINGLIWMGQKDEMLMRLKEKVQQGFTCIKIKVGAINFQEELDLLQFIRKSFSSKEIELRVDANGAFTPENALSKIEALSKFNIHSIEQPIKQRQWNEMAKLCQNSALPIALDEELIGISSNREREQMLDTIKPQFIILKPSLIGGLHEAEEWSELAKNRNVDWWVTSALEGNIGLNAIAQWTYLKGSQMPQGLGTGQVFSNNISSPLEIKGEELWYNTSKLWQEINF